MALASSCGCRREELARDRWRALRILLVDDHALVRSAIRQALTVDGIEIVGEGASAEEAVALATELRPDLVLMDIDLPGMSGIEAVRDARPAAAGHALRDAHRVDRSPRPA